MRKRRQRTVSENRLTLAYVRVSTEEQASLGVSLAAQEARIASYAGAMDFKVSSIIRDAGESAKSLQRPGMADLLSRVRENRVERVVVAKLDRLTRSIRDLSDLIDLCAKHEVALVSVAETLDTSSASGRMVVNMLGVVAQWEREAIAERTASALSHKRLLRTAYGPVPFGFVRVGSALVEEPTEQIALQEAIRLDIAGASFREIASMLTSRGISPKRGRTWHASSVRAMLRSKMTLDTRCRAS